MPDAVCQASFVLTVAECKRLIAKGVRRHPAVWAALSDGIVAVAKGSTNAYVAEELAEEGIYKPHYCTGTTRPAAGESDVEVANKLPDLVLHKGERVEGVSATEIVGDMGPGDVFIKGANALNYERGHAGILIGHPTGGTIGAAIGTVVARRAHLLLPVGLEKSVPHDLNGLYHRLTEAGEKGSGPTLWPVEGEIFTEIEALGAACGVKAAAIGAGGILGAEGGLRMSVWGAADEIERAKGFISGIHGEPAFGRD